MRDSYSTATKTGAVHRLEEMTPPSRWRPAAPKRPTAAFGERVLRGGGGDLSPVLAVAALCGGDQERTRKQSRSFENLPAKRGGSYAVSAYEPSASERKRIFSAHPRKN